MCYAGGVAYATHKAIKDLQETVYLWAMFDSDTASAIICITQHCRF